MCLLGSATLRNAAQLIIGLSAMFATSLPIQRGMTVIARRRSLVKLHVNSDGLQSAARAMHFGCFAKMGVPGSNEHVSGDVM